MKSRLICLIAVLLVIPLAACKPAYRDTPKTSSPPAVQPQATAPTIVEPERAARGRKLFEKIGSAAAAPRNPDVRGQMTPRPVLKLYVTNADWKRLSASDRIDLTYFVQSIIPVAKGSPEQYAGIPASAPLYERFVSVTRSLCDDCWSITLGDPRTTNGQPDFSVDRTIVQGDTPWEADEPCCRGTRASEFRKK